MGICQASLLVVIHQLSLGTLFPLHTNYLLSLTLQDEEEEENLYFSK